MRTDCRLFVRAESLRAFSTSALLIAIWPSGAAVPHSLLWPILWAIAYLRGLCSIRRKGFRRLGLQGACQCWQHTRANEAALFAHGADAGRDGFSRRSSPDRRGGLGRRAARGEGARPGERDPP